MKFTLLRYYRISISTGQVKNVKRTKHIGSSKTWSMVNHMDDTDIVSNSNNTYNNHLLRTTLFSALCGRLQTIQTVVVLNQILPFNRVIGWSDKHETVVRIRDPASITIQNNPCADVFVCMCVFMWNNSHTYQMHGVVIVIRALKCGYR